MCNVLLKQNWFSLLKIAMLQKEVQCMTVNNIVLWMLTQVAFVIHLDFFFHGAKMIF